MRSDRGEEDISQNNTDIYTNDCFFLGDELAALGYGNGFDEVEQDLPEAYYDTSVSLLSSDSSRTVNGNDFRGGTVFEARQDGAEGGSEPRRFYSAPIIVKALPVLSSLSSDLLKVYVNAKELGIPLSNQLKAHEDRVSIGEIVECVFKKRGKNSRFQIKLYTALALTKHRRDLFKVIGVMFVAYNIIYVDSEIFGDILGLKSRKESLFHSQGNFQTHQFKEVYLDRDFNNNDLLPDVDLSGLDYGSKRFYRHDDINMNSGIEVYEGIRWTRSSSSTFAPYPQLV